MSPLDSLAGWLAIACAAGTAVSAALIGALTAQSFVELPDEDRQYHDRPPLAFRCVWVPVRLLSLHLRPALPGRFREWLARQLRYAGLDFAVDAVQFVAFVLMMSLGAAALAGFVLASWHLRPWMGALFAALVGVMLSLLWLKDRVAQRSRAIHKSLPFMLDLITLCVEAGLTLQSAIAHAVAKGAPGPMRDELSRVLRDRRAGKSRTDALRDMSARMREPSVAALVAALVQSETLGMDLGPILRAQAEQRRVERFAAAEKLAMEAPVKMLFPLIAFIFPCTFIVLGFPIAIKFLRMGL
ncbi:MAG: type II secretion system F family protein [Proteobacteria bacterium]|nr:type II secretion system F family protein [Pseudomonadota bacterium]